MDPITMAAIMGGTSLISTGVKAYQANKQKKKGDSLERSLNRPTYEVPSYIRSNYDVAKKMSNEGISSEEENAFKDDLLSSSAASIRNFRSRKAALLGAEVIGNQVNDSLRDFRIADARQKIENQREFMKRGDILASYEDKAFQLNQLDPYAEKLNYARSLQAAGMTNMNRAIDDFTRSISSAGIGYMSTQIPK